MKLGILSDTHNDIHNATPHIIEKFKESGVEIILHCGDIIPAFLDPALFGNVPVCCALTDEQVLAGNAQYSSRFKEAPGNWNFTRPDDRVRTLKSIRTSGDMVRVYVGHKRSWEFLFGSEAEFFKTMDAIRKNHDMVRWLFSGHTHRQVYMQNPLISFINPGGVEDAGGVIGGYEYALVDSEGDKVTFSRIPGNSDDKRKALNLGIISDSFDISKKDPSFWKKLASALEDQRVTHLIHCGNLSLDDIGQPHLKQFEVYYYLREDQVNHITNVPDNWHQIPSEKPVVSIEGYHFCIQLALGADMLDKSEMDMHRLSLKMKSTYPEVKFILFGFTHSAFLEEGENVVLINPGDVEKNRSFVVITFPLTEITFDNIPVEPLPNPDKEKT